MKTIDTVLVILSVVNVAWATLGTIVTLEIDKRQQRLSMNKLLVEFETLVAALGRRLNLANLENGGSVRRPD